MHSVVSVWSERDASMLLCTSADEAMRVRAASRRARHHAGEKCNYRALITNGQLLRPSIDTPNPVTSGAGQPPLPPVSVVTRPGRTGAPRLRPSQGKASASGLRRARPSWYRLSQSRRLSQREHTLSPFVRLTSSRPHRRDAGILRSSQGRRARTVRFVRLLISRTHNDRNPSQRCDTS